MDTLRHHTAYQKHETIANICSWQYSDNYHSCAKRVAFICYTQHTHVWVGSGSANAPHVHSTRRAASEVPKQHGLCIAFASIQVIQSFGQPIHCRSFRLSTTQWSIDTARIMTRSSVLLRAAQTCSVLPAAAQCCRKLLSTV